MYIYVCIYIYIYIFRPAQDSAVWLGLTGREQLMSPECSKHLVLSLGKHLYDIWGVMLAKAQYLPTSFTWRLLQGQKTYTFISICELCF